MKPGEYINLTYTRDPARERFYWRIERLETDHWLPRSQYFARRTILADAYNHVINSHTYGLKFDDQSLEYVVSSIRSLLDDVVTYKWDYYESRAAIITWRDVSLVLRPR